MALDPSELDLDAATMTARCVGGCACACVCVCMCEKDKGGKEGGRASLTFVSVCLCRYEEQTKLQKEDLSDMVAEHAAKQKVLAS